MSFFQWILHCLHPLLLLCLHRQAVKIYLHINDSQVEAIKQHSSVVLIEGLSPVTTKLLDKNQRSKFGDLPSLLSCDPTAKNDTVALIHEGHHIPVVDPQNQFNHHKKQITDLLTWI